MARTSVLLLACVLGFTLTLSACSDDNPTGGGSKDTSPPAISLVSSPDAFHVTVRFDEPLAESAQRPWYYTIVETNAAKATGTLAPGDTVNVAVATLIADHRWVSLATGRSLLGKTYTLFIASIQDLNGNAVTTPLETVFTASNVPDTTPPEVVSAFPEPGATGVELAGRVFIYFSEPIDFDSFTSGVIWTNNDGEPLEWGGGGGSNEYQLFNSTPLENSMTYTITLKGIRDGSGNTMPNTQWTYTTAYSSDRTGPVLISTAPQNNAVDVDVNTAITMNFSEPIDRSFLWGLELWPQPGGAGISYSDDFKTITYHPLPPLEENRQYRFTIFPGRLYDLAGNGIEELHTIVFTTGSQLENGGISGVISATTGTVTDPTGAMVFAVKYPYLGEVYGVAGSAVVEGNNAYHMSHVADGSYYLIAVMDSDHNNELNPHTGDAIGGYGVNTPGAEPKTVTLAGGASLTQTNFALQDPSVFIGTVIYEGNQPVGEGKLQAGLFEAATFNPASPNNPLVTWFGFWPRVTKCIFNSMLSGFPDGNYYVFAYLDLNNSGTYEPAADPAGAYGGTSMPTVAHLSNGADVTNIVIKLHDPVQTSSVVSITWPERHNVALEQLFNALEKTDLTTRQP